MKTSIFLFCLFLGFSAWSQILPNGNFENYSISNTQNCRISPSFGKSTKAAPLQSCGTVPKEFSAWFVTHGTPELYDGSEVNRSTALALWAGTAEDVWEDVDGETYGEGVVLYCPEFEKGKRYTFNFKVRTTSQAIAEVNIYLVKGNHLNNSPINYDDPVYYKIPNVPAVDKQLIFQGIDFQSSTMQDVSVGFTPNDNFDKLWIYIDE